MRLHWFDNALPVFRYIWAPFISNINHAIGCVPILGMNPIQIEQLNEYSMFQTSYIRCNNYFFKEFDHARPLCARAK